MGIAELAGRPLHWKQTRITERRYLLRADDVEVATLAFRSAFGSLATGESGEGSWTFKRIGFFSTRITVRAANSDTDLAVYTPKTWSGGGTLAFPDGRGIRVTTNLWQTSVDFLADDGEPLLHLAVGGLFGLSVDVQVLPAASRHDALPWLVMLACYLIVSMRDDGAAVAVIAAG